MSSAVMPCCFEHRYSQLLEEGLVDDRTVLIDRDRLTFLEKENRSRGEIAKMYGVKKDDITRMKALERSLLVQEREKAVSLLPPLPEAEIRAMEASVPDDSPDDSESEPKSESSEVVPDYGSLRKAIVTIMGPDPARPLHVQLMRAWCEVDGDPQITVDRSELKEARWFTRDEIPLERTNDRASMTGEMIERFRTMGRAAWE